MENYQAVFKRKEIKYLLSSEERNALLPILEAHMEPDAFAHSSISNLYYDTPDFRMVRRSLEKPMYKEKLRLRSYGTPEKAAEWASIWKHLSPASSSAETPPKAVVSVRPLFSQKEAASPFCLTIRPHCIPQKQCAAPPISSSHRRTSQRAQATRFPPEIQKQQAPHSPDPFQPEWEEKAALEALEISKALTAKGLRENARRPPDRSDNCQMIRVQAGI